MPAGWSSPRVLGAVVATAALAGCSLLTSLSGYSNGEVGPDAAVSTEGGAEAGAGDASVDAQGGDGSVVTIDPCEGATFCDRFERADTQGDWRALGAEFGAKLELDTSTWTSPQKSLHMFLPTGDSPRGALYGVDYPDIARARVAFDMKVVEGIGRVVQLVRMQWVWPVQGGDASTVTDVLLLTDKILIAEQLFTPSGGTGYADYAVTGSFKPNTWQRWTMELDATGPTTLGVFTIDGKEVLRRTMNNVTKKGTFHAILGSVYLLDGPARNVYFDDFALKTF